MKNYHILKVSYLGATNSKGSRVKITSECFNNSKTISYDHSISGGTREIAIEYLVSKGFNIIGMGEGKDHYYIITDTFEPVV